MSDIERLTDSDLVAAYRAGDPDAFAEIYDRYSADVFSYFLTHGRSREDAAHATYATFKEASSRLDLKESPADLAPWLLGIAASTSGGPDPASVLGNHVEMSAAPPALRPRVLDEVQRDIVSAFSVGALDPEWVRIGIFAVVTLVVGLIGLLVASSFEPLQPAQTAPQAEAPPLAATTTTSTPVTTASSPAVAGASTSTTASTPAGPPVFVVAEDSVNFGEDGTTGEIEVTNSGDGPGQWRLESSSQAIALSEAQGQLGPGDSTTVEVRLDREAISEGDMEETLMLTWDDGQLEIAVVGSHEDNPIIHNPQANPPSVEVSGSSECTNTETRITARVRDTSPLESVVAQWSPDGGGQQETAMSPFGEDMFEAVIGPFTAVGTVDVRVVAFDERGNAGGATLPVAVVECP